METVQHIDKTSIPSYGGVEFDRRAIGRRLRAGRHDRSESRPTFLDRRIDEIDATRGVAMLFVCLSHFAMAYFDKTGAKELALWSTIISQISSPTFMLLSGMMLGLLYRKHANDFNAIRVRLIGRGIYLLTLIHLLILIPHVVFEGGIFPGLHWMFMTDTIGVCMILGALLIDRIPARWRVVLSALLYAGGLLAVYSWHPAGAAGSLIKDILFGEGYSAGYFREIFALVPWFSYYFGASVVGEWLAASRASRKGREWFAEGVWRWTGAFAVVSGFLFLSREMVRSLAPRVVNLNLMEILSVTSKRPPSPAYFIVHCGMALMALAGFYSWGRSTALTRLGASVASLHGRSSLFVYVLHYYVYLIFLIPFTSSFSNYWPVLFLGSLFVMTAASYLWDRGKIQHRLIFPSLSVPLGPKVPRGGNS
jgi:uncharacterized membrane protein